MAFRLLNPINPLLHLSTRSLSLHHIWLELWRNLPSSGQLCFITLLLFLKRCNHFVFLFYSPPPLATHWLCTAKRANVAVHVEKDKTEGGDRWVESESEKAKTKDSKQKIDSGCKWVLAKGESDRREQTRASLYWHVSVCLTPSLQWILSGHKCTTRWEFIKKKKTFIIRN